MCKKNLIWPTLKSVFGLILYVPVNNLSILSQHCFFRFESLSQSTAMVKSWQSVHLTTLFSCASLTKQVNQYFLHILLLVTDNNPSWISRREDNDRRNYFMINLHKSMEPGRDPTRDPWFCSQTGIYSQIHYLLCYPAQYVRTGIPGLDQY